jgi:hypothetical protein
MRALAAVPALHERWSSVFYAGLTALAVVAFWPGYLAMPKLAFGGWTHFHVATAALWMLLLMVQPWAIRTGRRGLHVALGRASYVLVPLIVIGFVGLAHASMQGKTPQGQAVDAYFFYIRVVLVAIFAGAYVLGVVHRSKREVHSRYMLATGLPLIDPVVHRIAQRAMGGADLNYQLLTFGLPCAILLALIVASRQTRPGRRALVNVLAWFVIGGLPLALDFYTWSAPWQYWKAVARQFAALPLP